MIYISCLYKPYMTSNFVLTMNRYTLIFEFSGNSYKQIMFLCFSCIFTGHTPEGFVRRQ